MSTSRASRSTAPPRSPGQPWTTGIYSGGSYNRILQPRARHRHRLPCTSKGGSGIGVDSYYKGMYSEVVGNSVHDIGPPGCRYVQGIYVNTPGTVRNNVVYRVAEAGVHLWHDAHKVIVVNNTITASNTGILVGGGDFYHTKGPNDNTHVFNNIVYDNRFGISEQGATGKHNSYRNNLVFGNREADWRLAEGMRHSGTIAAAPGIPRLYAQRHPGLPPGGGFAGDRQGPRTWRRRPRLLRQGSRRQTPSRRLPALRAPTSAPASTVFADAPCPKGFVRRSQDLVHQLRRPAQAHALRRHHERPVDQDRVGDHGIQQGLVADAGASSPSSPYSASLLRTASRTDRPARAIISLNCSRSGGVAR
jgi:hypothetical protein